MQCFCSPFHTHLMLNDLLALAELQHVMFGALL